MAAGKNIAAADLALVGTWEFVYGDDIYTVIFGESDFEHTGDTKGAYKTDGNTIIFTPTHLWDDVTNSWITKEDLIKDEPYLAFLFSPFTVIYSISGGKLTITLDDDYKETYTKQ